MRKNETSKTKRMKNGAKATPALYLVFFRSKR